MTVRKYSSISQETTLTTALNSSATTMVVSSATALLGTIAPAAGETFTVVIDPDTALEEIVDVIYPSSSASNTITIQRSVEAGSLAISHSAGAKVRHMAIGRDFRETNDHLNNTTSAHGLTIANVVSTTDTSKVSGAMIVDGAVGTAKIDNAAVTEAKIGTSAVTTTKIADLNVTTGKINDLAVTTGKIADSAITSAKIADLTIATGDIADGAITSAKIADLTIATGDIADSAVTQAKIADGSVTSAKIADLTIATGDIADGAITSAKIADLTIATGDIADSAITSAKIADGAIVNADVNTSAQIAYSKLNLTNSVTNADINATAAIALSKLATDPLARANHTGTQTSGTISDFDSQVRTSRLDQMAAPTGSVSLNSQKITNLATPTATTDASTKGYVDTSINNLIGGAPATLDTLSEIATALNNTANFSDTVVLKSGSTMTGALDMGTTNKITNVADPTNAQDVATKHYIDSAVLAPSNLTGPITSVGSATSVASQTGTGTKFVMDTSPTLVTPNIGVATATSINGTTIPTSKTLVATDSTAYVVPSQTGNSGKYLTTNGTASSWATVDALPSQATHSGQFLTTDGTVASWTTVAASPLTGTGGDPGDTIYTGSTTPSSPTTGDIWIDTTPATDPDLKTMILMGAY